MKIYSLAVLCTRFMYGIQTYIVHTTYNSISLLLQLKKENYLFVSRFSVHKNKLFYDVRVFVRPPEQPLFFCAIFTIYIYTGVHMDHKLHVLWLMFNMTGGIQWEPILYYIHITSNNAYLCVHTCSFKLFYKNMNSQSSQCCHNMILCTYTYLQQGIGISIAITVKVA